MNTNTSTASCDAMPTASAPRCEVSHGKRCECGFRAIKEPQRLLTVDDVARWLGKPKATLYTWRSRQVGPRGIRVGNALRYRRSEVERWLDEHTDDTTPRCGRRDEAEQAGDGITSQTLISRLGQVWLEAIISEGRLAPQTINRYEDSLRCAVLPALGSLRLREAARVSQLDQFLKTTAKGHPTKARHAKNVLGQMLAMAVRHDAIDANPIREVGRLRRNHTRPRALTAEQLTAVRAAIRRWQTPEPGKPGPRPSRDLADIVDLLLATGARIGEVLALRWSDIDLAAARPTVTFNGTLVYVKGRAIFRQEQTKTDAGYRTVTLPRFATDMLLRRKLDAVGNPHDAIFPSRRRTWLSPNNVRRQWRQARADTGLEWVTPHTFRKTVATLLDREADTKTAAAQLGHASEQITTRHYVDKPHQAPDTADVLNMLGPNMPTT